MTTISNWLLESLEYTNVAGELTLLLLSITSGVLPISRTMLCLVSGFVFGLPAIPIVIIGTSFGAVIGFLIARTFFANRIYGIAQNRRLLSYVLSISETHDWVAVLTIRLTSILPTTVQNYVFGISKVRLCTFSFLTILCYIPQISVYIYFGAAGKQSLADGWGFRAEKIFLVSIFLAFLLGVQWILRMRTRFHSLTFGCQMTRSNRFPTQLSGNSLRFNAEGKRRLLLYAKEAWARIRWTIDFGQFRRSWRVDQQTGRLTLPADADNFLVVAATEEPCANAATTKIPDRCCVR